MWIALAGGAVGSFITALITYSARFWAARSEITEHDRAARERNEVRRHPLAGARLIRSFDSLRPALPYVLFHHERWERRRLSERPLPGGDPTGCADPRRRRRVRRDDLDAAVPPGAVTFLTEAFGFREVDRTTGAGGGMHVELEVGSDGAHIYLGAPGGDFRGPATVGRTSLLYVLVDDVDRHHEQAKAAGAKIVEELTDLPYGDRRYGCRDPQGHEWTFAAPISGGDATR